MSRAEARDATARTIRCLRMRNSFKGLLGSWHRTTALTPPRPEGQTGIMPAILSKRTDGASKDQTGTQLAVMREW